MDKFKTVMDFSQNIIRYKKIILYLFIPLVGIIMHWRVFPLDLMSIHVWRQTQTQTVINNFYQEDMNILNSRINGRGEGDGIFRMEFPIMQWLFACFYRVFGNHIIISRILTFILGLFSIWGIYRILKYLFNDEATSIAGAWCFTFSPSFFYYTVNPLPDNFSLCFSIWGIFFFLRHYSDNKTLSLFLSNVAFSLSSSAKLPFIIFYSIPLIYFLNQIISKKNTLKLYFQILLSFLTVLPVLIWYLSVIPSWKGNGIVTGMLNNSTDWNTILDYLQHNLISTLPELLLNYGSLLFFVAGLYFIYKEKPWTSIIFRSFFFCSILLILYFLFEINMIAKIHDYYLFPFLPLLFIIVSYGIHKLKKINSVWKIVILVLLLVLPLTAYLRMKVRWTPESPGFNKDLLVFKNELRAAVPANALVVAGNDLSTYIFLYYIDKKGWVFSYDDLSYDKLKSLIDRGAQYLYTDSQKILEDVNIQSLLDNKIEQKGRIFIYSLKQ